MQVRDGMFVEDDDDQLIINDFSPIELDKVTSKAWKKKVAYMDHTTMKGWPKKQNPVTLESRTVETGSEPSLMQAPEMKTENKVLDGTESKKRFRRTKGSKNKKKTNIEPQLEIKQEVPPHLKSTNASNDITTVVEQAEVPRIEGKEENDSNASRCVKAEVTMNVYVLI